MNITFGVGNDGVVIQSLGQVRFSATPWTVAHQASLSFTNSWSLLKRMSFELVILSNHLILCHPLFLLPSIFLSIRVFSNESALCIRWHCVCKIHPNCNLWCRFSLLYSIPLWESTIYLYILLDHFQMFVVISCAAIIILEHMLWWTYSHGDFN